MTLRLASVAQGKPHRLAPPAQGRTRRTLLLLPFLVVLATGCQKADDRPREDRAAREIDEQLAPGVQVEPRDGLAAAIVIDVSGSMEDDVRGEDGREIAKIEVARRAARDLVEQFAKYAEAHPNEPV